MLTRAHSSGIADWYNANERLRTQVLGGVGHISVGRRGECNAEVKDTEKAALECRACGDGTTLAKAYTNQCERALIVGCCAPACADNGGCRMSVGARCACNCEQMSIVTMRRLACGRGMLNWGKVCVVVGWTSGVMLMCMWPM